MKYREAVRQGAAMLTAAGVDAPDLDAWLLMSHVSGMDRSRYFLHGEEEMTQELQEAYFDLARQRAKRIPLQHLTGTQDFMGLTFEVNENVLVPRQDTELLAETAIGILLDRHNTPENSTVDCETAVLDLCCGSGCLAVSIRSFCPYVSVTAADLSGEALNVARRNAMSNHCEDIRFLQGDLFEPVDGTFRMIVSNPPYIPTGEIAGLMPEVRDHEPVMALDGDADGLSFYRRIIAQAPDYLEEGGWLLFEIGYDQGTSVSELMITRGFADVRVLKDLAGLDRTVMGRWHAVMNGE